ncbi:hypothetical protein FACS1894132_00890 [Clostridia bacterium]|nr:hypothetical protein FACS1894132_00890 [Clostridia bacterium]
MVKIELTQALTRIYDELKKKKKLPVGKTDKKFIVSAAKPRHRQVTVFGHDEIMKNAFEDGIELISEKFTKTIPQWLFGGVVIAEEKMLITDFCKKISEGFSDWDGISFDQIYNFALLKQDINNFSLVTKTGCLNDTYLTKLFLRMEAIDSDLAFTSNKIKYITVFKIDGFALYNDTLIEYNSTELKADKPYSLLPYIVSNEHRINTFNDKFNSAVKVLKKNSALIETVSLLPKKVIFISVSDVKERATIFSGIADDLQKALNIAKKNAQNYISSFALNPIWVKVDVIIEDTVKTFDDFTKDLYDEKRPYFKKHGNPGAYFYDKGISFTDNYDFAFLSQEINSEGIWDFEQRKYNLTKNNEILIKKGFPVLKTIPQGLHVFKTLGYICDENNVVYRLINKKPNEDYYGRRDVRNLSKDDVAEMVKHSAQFLISIQKDDGSFIYGMHPSSGKTLTSYNILRHITTSLAILQYYSLSDTTDTTEADKCNEYALKYLRYKDKDTAFIFDNTPKEFKLGSNAVSVITLATYSDFFPTDKYNEYIRVLANGILEFYEGDGSFYHVWNEDFSPKEKTRIVYYDGEAVYGLIRAYDLLGDKKYLDAAEKAVDYFIENHYEQYTDHWVAYSLNHITKHLPKQKYFNFGLYNATVNLKKIADRRSPFHTYLELLTQTFTLSNRLDKLIAEGQDLYVPESFDKIALAKTILHRIDYMANSYLYPEFAMYMNEPQKSAYTFVVRHWDWRIRIDDLGHFIGAFYEFLQRYDDIVTASQL